MRDDTAVRRFTNGELTLKELVGVIERTILPELRAAQNRFQQLQHVPREQAKLVAEADRALQATAGELAGARRGASPHESERYAVA